jgi:hypothetical protein
VNSALLLLRSANSAHPNGLANSSGLVGRNYMVHNNTALMAVDPGARIPRSFRRPWRSTTSTSARAGFRLPDGQYPMLGKLQAGMLTAAKPLVPRPILQGMADRSVDWWVMSEDLPSPDNRVTLRAMARWSCTGSPTTWSRTTGSSPRRR